MSALWPSARAIGRRGGCLAAPPAFLRNAVTAAKPRVQKTAPSAVEATAKNAKSNLSTKPRASTAAKPQRKKAEAPAPPISAIKPTPTATKPTPKIPAFRPAPTTQATKPAPTIQNTKPTPTIQATKPTPAPFTKNIPAPKNLEVMREAKTQATAQKTGTEAPAAATVVPQAPVVGAWKPTGKPREPVKKPVNVNGPEYKSAARKWTAVMVALPILAVTSYYLYDRRTFSLPDDLFIPPQTNSSVSSRSWERARSLRPGSHATTADAERQGPGCLRFELTSMISRCSMTRTISALSQLSPVSIVTGES